MCFPLTNWPESQLTHAKESLKAMASKTVVTQLVEMGLEESDILVRYVKARHINSLEVFRLAGHFA